MRLLLISLTDSSKIVDDHFEHALRLWRDRDSDGIRLQASVHRGELKRYFHVTYSPFLHLSLTWPCQKTGLDGLYNTSDQLSDLDATRRLENDSPRRSATAHFR